MSRVIEEQNTIKKGIPSEAEFKGTDEELENEIKTFEMKRHEDEILIKDLERRKNEVENESECITTKIEEFQSQLGALNQEKNQYEEKCMERDKLIVRVKEEMDMRLSQDCSNIDEARRDLKEIQDVLKSWQNDVNVWIEEKKNEENRGEAIVQQLKESKINIETNIKFKKEQIEEHEQKKADINDDLIGLSLFEEQIKDYTIRIEEINEKIANLTGSFNEHQENIKMENYNKSIEEMEHYLDNTKKELRILQQNDVIRKNLERETSFMEEKLNEIKKDVTKHFSSLKLLFGEATPERNVVGAILLLQAEAEITLKNLKEKIAKKQNDVQAEQVDCCHLMDRISSCEKQLAEKRLEILRFCDGKTLDEAIQISRQNKERLQLVKAQYDSMIIIFTKYINQFEKESPCCPICETDFTQTSELVEKIVANLKKKLVEIPRKLAIVEDELLNETNRYNKLQQLIVVNDANEKLKTETLPQLKDQFQRNEQIFKDDKQALVDLEAQLKRPQKIIEISKSIISDMSVLDQNQIYVEKSQKAIASLKGKLLYSCPTRFTDKVEEEIMFLESKLAEMKMAASKMSKKISEYKEQEKTLTEDRKKLEEEQIRIKEKIQGKSLLESQRNEVIAKIEYLKKEVLVLTSKLTTTVIDLQKAVQDKNDTIRINNELIQEEEKKINIYKNTVGDIEKLQKEIENYQKEEPDNKISSTKKKLEDYKKTRDVLIEDKANLVLHILDKKEELARKELTFRILEDNVILRDKIALQAKLEAEIQLLLKQVADKVPNNVQEEESLLSSQEVNLEKQLNHLLGEKDALMNVVKELQEDLDKPNNKDAFDSYMNTYYELKIIENLVYDLDKYINGLEGAMLDFRNEKLQEINDNLKELWRNIYRGNDIDYIEIKSEFVANVKKQGHVYKIVQVRNGCEQEMKRHCSASQKLIASLIIRLALAETLGVNCGIFTIDEPTTNLDKENLQGLCDTLARLVQVKRRRENKFQLLIITHDEEFLQSLMKSQEVLNFYRVMRDEDGFCVIKEEIV